MNRNLSKKEYDEIVQEFGWADDNRLVAEKVIVENVSVADAADYFDKSRQRVNNLVKQVWDAYINKMAVPDDWEVVTVPLPKEEAKKITELSARLREKLIAKSALEKK
jgi:Holliday junction resolvase RusA-like endonuclease